MVINLQWNAPLRDEGNSNQSQHKQEPIEVEVNYC